jgi:hypothetical protein
MKMSASILGEAFAGNGAHQKSKPRPFKIERVGHPEKLNPLLNVAAEEWYYPNCEISSIENCGRVRHPPPGKAKPAPRFGRTGVVLSN